MYKYKEDTYVSFNKPFWSKTMDIQEICIKTGYYMAGLKRYLKENEKDCQTIFGKDWDYIFGVSDLIGECVKNSQNEERVAASAYSLGEIISNAQYLVSEKEENKLELTKIALNLPSHLKMISNVLDKMGEILGID
jgi:hypothetical protein